MQKLVGETDGNKEKLSIEAREEVGWFGGELLCLNEPSDMLLLSIYVECGASLPMNSQI